MPELRYPRPPLKDGTVALRQPVEGDAAEVTAACQDPMIVRYTQVPAGYTEDHARNWFEISAQQRRRGTGVHFLVVDAEGGDLLGSVDLHEVDWEDRRATIGYWTAPEARGRGVATRAVRLLSQWAFEALGLARVQIYVDVTNAGSQRVAERAGFVREGVLRSHSQLKGERFDSVIFSLLPVDLGDGAE
jgi:RimJ/RimL family protein N-acetyltransferase